MLKHQSFAAAAILSLLALPAVSFAQRLDTPTVTLSDASAVSLTFEVRAGASGAPNGFYVEWMTKDEYDFNGGWPADPSSGGVYYCEFTGVPTYNTWADGADYVLGPFESAWIEVGDLFDETGMITDYNVELDPDVEYVIRAYAGAPTEEETSYYSGTGAGSTIQKQNCIKSQGYWKNHQSAWPVNSLTLGSVSYTKAQLVSILNRAAQGNGLIILAKQLIATKLNIANGGSTSQIASAVAAADAMIGNRVVPPVGSGYLTPSSVNSTKNQLDNYNNGKLHATCGPPTAAAGSTWGELKTRYR